MSGQRGSALAFVLIAVAILAILGAVILAEISTHISASQKATQRVAYEATLNSAIEYGVRALQDSSAPGTAGCATDSNNGRTWSQPVLNGLNSNVTYQCSGTTPAATFGPTAFLPLNRGDSPYNGPSPRAALPVKSPFNYQGTELTGTGCRTDYVITDLAGMLYDYPWGTRSALSSGEGWNYNLGVPPAFAPVASCASPLPTTGSVFVPVNNAGYCTGGTASCVVRIDEPSGTNGNTPTFSCQAKKIPANNKNATIVTQPSMGVASPANVYLGFGGQQSSNQQNIVVLDPNCNPIASDHSSTAPPQGVGLLVAGPFVGEETPLPSNAGDDLYVVENVVSGTNMGAYILHYQCSNNGSGNLCQKGSNGEGNKLTLLAGTSQLFGTGQAVGMSVTNTPATSTKLPARGVVTGYSGTSGEIAVFTINLNGTLSNLSSLAIPNASALTPPSWCPAPICDPSNDIIGVGSAATSGPTKGAFYRLTAGTLASPAAVAIQSTLVIQNTPAITTRPVPDPYADWYMGADDGNLYVLQPGGASFLSFATNTTTPTSPVMSAPVIDNCLTSSVCVYVATGSTDDTAYLLTGGLVSVGRVAYLFACTSVPPASAPSPCNSSNFKAWAQVQVTNGSATVQSWSYSNPSP
jgi:type II secretory pathway pseudopilin PulG